MIISMPDNYGFPVFKGLQKPLEFMGIRGRFITLAAISIGCSFIGCMIASFMFGQLIGFAILAILSLASLITIYVKQKEGLHAKKKFKGIIIYHHILKRD